MVGPTRRRVEGFSNSAEKGKTATMVTERDLSKEFGGKLEATCRVLKECYPRSMHADEIVREIVDRSLFEFPDTGRGESNYLATFLNMHIQRSSKHLRLVTRTAPNTYALEDPQRVPACWSVIHAACLVIGEGEGAQGLHVDQILSVILKRGLWDFSKSSKKKDPASVLETQLSRYAGKEAALLVCTEPLTYALAAATTPRQTAAKKAKRSSKGSSKLAKKRKIAPKAAPKATSATATNKDPEGKDAVGWRVGVWWDEDEAFYYGVLTVYDEIEEVHKIAYEDGQEELISLSEEKLEWVAANAVAAPTSPSTPIPQINAPEPAKKAKVAPKSAPKATAVAATNKDPEGKDAVGWRVGVWWDEDEAFYYGVLTVYDEIEEVHKIAYEDGQEELISLSEEKLEWVEANAAAASIPPSTPVPQIPAPELDSDSPQPRSEYEHLRSDRMAKNREAMLRLVGKRPVMAPPANEQPRQRQEEVEDLDGDSLWEPEPEDECDENSMGSVHHFAFPHGAELGTLADAVAHVLRKVYPKGLHLDHILSAITAAKLWDFEGARNPKKGLSRVCSERANHGSFVRIGMGTYALRGHTGASTALGLEEEEAQEHFDPSRARAGPRGKPRSGRCKQQMKADDWGGMARAHKEKVRPSCSGAGRRRVEQRVSPPLHWKKRLLNRWMLLN